MDRYGAWAGGTALVAAAIGVAVAGAVAASSLATVDAPAILPAMAWVVSGILLAPIGAIAGLVAWLPVGAWIALHSFVKDAHRDATAAERIQGDPDRLAAELTAGVTPPRWIVP